MSTGLNCQIIEPATGKWFYVLENSGASNQPWDWREQATATGPFATEKECRSYLSDHEANPGGFSVIPNADFEMDAVYDSLISSARSPRSAKRQDWYDVPTAYRRRGSC